MPCTIHTVPFGVDGTFYEGGVGPALVVRADGDSIERRVGVQKFEVPLFTFEESIPHHRLNDPTEALQATWEASIGRVLNIIQVLRQTFLDVEGELPGLMAIFVRAQHPTARTFGNTKGDRVASFDPFTERSKARVIIGGDEAKGWVVKVEMGIVARRASKPGDPGVFGMERSTRLLPPLMKPGMDPEQLTPLVKWEVNGAFFGDID